MDYGEPLVKTGFMVSCLSRSQKVIGNDTDRSPAYSLAHIVIAERIVVIFPNIDLMW